MQIDLKIRKVMSTLSLFVLVQVVSYYSLDITSINYYLIINLLLFIACYMLVKYQISKLSKDPTDERKK